MLQLRKRVVLQLEVLHLEVLQLRGLPVVRSSSDVKFILFADHSSMFASVNCLTNFVTLTNEALRMIKLCLERNHLTLKENKTQFLVFHRKQRTYPIVNTVYLGDYVVKCVNNVNFL